MVGYLPEIVFAHLCPVHSIEFPIWRLSRRRPQISQIRAPRRFRRTEAEPRLTREDARQPGLLLRFRAEGDYRWDADLRATSGEGGQHAGLNARGLVVEDEVVEDIPVCRVRVEC